MKEMIKMLETLGDMLGVSEEELLKGLRAFMSDANEEEGTAWCV